MANPRRRSSHLRTGASGEALAATHLEAAGLEVLDRNWTCRWGELDVVCEDGDVLVFVEVRSRRTRRFGTPEESIDPRKMGRVVRAARRWMAAHDDADRAVRFDVVAVDLSTDPPAIRHHRGAFDLTAIEP